MNSRGQGHLGANSGIGSKYLGISPTRGQLGQPNSYYPNMPGSSTLTRNFASYDSKLNYSNFDRNDPNHGYHSYGNFGNNQNYSPHHERSLAGSTTIMGGHISSSEKNIQTPVGAPPVNRLVDLMNKPTFSNSPNLISPNDSRKYNNEYLSALDKTLPDLPCDLNFILFIKVCLIYFSSCCYLNKILLIRTTNIEYLLYRRTNLIRFTAFLTRQKPKIKSTIHGSQSSASRIQPQAMFSKSYPFMVKLLNMW